MNRWTVLLTMLSLSAFLILSCSGGGSDPISPGPDTELMGANPHTAQAQTHLWGYFDIYVDVETQSVEVVSARNTAFTANVTKFINGSPTNLGLSINGVAATVNYVDIDMDISITHPFAGMTDFNGYDVRGVFMGKGSQSIIYQMLTASEIGGTDQHMYDYDIAADPDPYPGLAGMPDGYTRWFNAKEFNVDSIFGYTEGLLATPYYQNNLTAEVNPYKYFADGLDADGDVWDFLETHTGTNGVFTAGGTNTRNFYLRFPQPEGIKFGYAIIADWGGPEPENHPSNAVETMACRVDDNSTIYYVDDGNKGGDLILTIHTWSWDVQPTRLRVGSSVLGGPTEITTSTPGGDHYHTWELNTPADNITKSEGNEFWVICEFDDYDYKNELGIVNGAEDDPLAAYFRFDLPVGSDPDCTTSVVSITPDTASSGTSLDDVNIEVTELEVGPNLAAKFSMSGKPDIVGSDVQFVDTTHLTADFDLAGAAKGLWDVVVTNGCGGIPGIGVEMFEVTGGFLLIDSGPLPSPEPSASLENMDFCALGDINASAPGVYFYYSEGSGDYQVYYYPLDYSSAGTLFYELDYTWPTDVFGGIGMMTSIEVTSNGLTILASECDDLNIYDPTDYKTSESYWITDDVGYIQLCNFWWDCPFRDFDLGFGENPDAWAFWGSDFDQNPDGYQSKVIHPYDDLAMLTEYENYFPMDYSGSVDGEVSDLESYKIAVDTDPQGLSSSYDIINYYLEASPDDGSIEVFQNSTMASMPSLITTIDSALVGEPVDIAVLNTFGNVDGAEGNYLCVLEDNGDGTFQVALFDQDGVLIERYSPPLDGDGLALDCDTENQEVHVWADDGGTLEFAKFGYY